MPLLGDAALALDPVAFARAVGITPDPWQAKLLRSSAPRILLNVTRQGGKALDVDTPIPTPDGWKTMGTLAPGDTVFDEMGRPCAVLMCSPVTHRERHRVVFSDGSELFADAEHLWTTLDAAARSVLSRTVGDIPADWAAWKGKGRAVARARLAHERACSFAGCDRPFLANGYCAAHNGQIARGKVVLTPLRHRTAGAATLTTSDMRATLVSGERGDTNHSIPATQALDLPDVDLPIDPYVLGAWLGDGHSASARITCHEDDSAILDECAGAGHAVTRHDYAAKNVPTWTVHGLFPQLRVAGLLGNKHIPAAYLRSSPAQRIALLQGLMDTDGYASSVDHQGRCEFTTTSARLAHDVYELMAGLGLIPRTKRGSATLDGRVIGPKWRISFYPRFTPFRLARKAAEVRLDGSRKGLRKLRYVMKIEPAGMGDVRCIAVSSPSQLYLAGPAMIPTHNSTTIGLLAAHTVLYQPGALVLVLSPSQRQSGELFKKLLAVYRGMGRPVPADAENVLSLELANGSRVVTVPGREGTVRGYSGVRPADHR